MPSTNQEKRLTWQDVGNAIENLVSALLIRQRVPDTILAFTDQSKPEMELNKMLAWELAFQIRDRLRMDSLRPILVPFTHVASRREVTFQVREALDGKRRALVVQFMPIAERDFRVVLSFIEAILPSAIEVIWGIIISTPQFEATLQRHVSNPAPYLIGSMRATKGMLGSVWTNRVVSGAAVAITHGSPPHTDDSAGFKVVRPWGWMDVISINQDHRSLRVLNMLPHRRLSLQRHRRRGELFIALDDGLTLELRTGCQDLSPMRLFTGESYRVPRLTWHRLNNPGSSIT